MMKPVSCCASLLFLIAHNLLGIARVVQSQSTCRLAFDLLDDISNEYTSISASVGGASFSPTLDDPVRPLGQLYVVVPTEGAACPEGGQAWLRRLQDGARIGLETNGTIMLTPNPLVVSVAALSSLSIADVELVQSGTLRPRGEAYEAALDFELVGGSTAGVDLAEANVTSSTVTAAEFSLSQGEVLMSFPNLTLTIPVALGGFAVEMELRGAQAALSDSAATAAAASAGPPPPPPPLPPSEEEEEQEEAPEPESSPLLDALAPVLAGDGREEAVELRVDLDAQLAASLTDRDNTCLMGSTGVVDEDDDACSCESDWKGSQCQTCTSDGACRAFLSRSNAECRSDPQFFPDTQMKAYTCSLPESVASVVGTDASFMCVTVDNPYLGFNGTLERLERLMQLPAGALSGTAGDGLQYGKQCRVDLSVSGTPLSCAGVSCNFGVGGASALCEMAECKCRKGQEADCDPTVVQLANSLVLRGVQLKEVDAGNGLFFLGLQGPGDSQLGAQVLCEVSDCACKDQVCGEVLTDEQIADGNETDWWVPLITGSPLMVLLAIAIANAVAIVAQWQLFANHLAGRYSEFTGAWTDLDQDMPLKQEPWGETGKGERGELCLRWRNVSCVVARGTKRILDSVSGEAWEGELLGILGPSGSGKSTLLSIISGSRQDVSPDAQVTGRIELGDTALRTSRLAKAAAFVPQEDDLLPCLTVQETLRYAALLQLPQDCSPEVISQRINDVMADLGIAKVANQRVGGRGGVRGISGGERRRVTIAMEMLPDPKLLLMDEPTSGLDSYTARRLLITCRNIAERGRVVVASIHQPSPEMFSMLDRVMLMSSGRSLFYGRPEAAEGFFQDARLPVPPGRAVADHMMAVACMPGACQHVALGSRGGSDEHRETEPVTNGEPGGRMVELMVCDSGARMGSAPPEPASLTATQPAELASPGSGGSDAEAGDPRRRNGPEFAEVALEAEEAAAAALPPPLSPMSPLAGSPEPLDMSGSGGRSMLPQAGWGREMAVLFWRGSLDIGRNRGLLVLHIVLALVMGVLVGVTFLDQKLDRDGAQNRLGAMFFTLCLFAFNAITSVDLLLSERSLVTREVVAGYYGVVPYMVTKLTLDGLLLRVVPVLLYSMLMYPLIGLQDGNVEVATFLMVLALFASTVGALTVACTAVLRTPGQVLVVLNFVLLMSVMMGGYLVNKDSIAAAIKWLHFAQPFSYAFALMATNELKSLLLNISIADIGSADITGGLLLSELGITTDKNTLYAWVLVVFYVGFASIALLALWARIRAGHWLYRVLGRGAKAAP